MTQKIVSYKSYVAGWFDSSVHDFLKVLSPRAASTKYALITCIDSQPNPASRVEKSPELKAVAEKFARLRSELMLPTRTLIDVDANNRVFFGFDEVWFFPDRNVRPKPPSLTLVGPARLNQTRLARLGKWMTANSCSLAIGGGEGLNFVVRAHGLARSLLGYSIEQPESAFVSL